MPPDLFLKGMNTVHKAMLSLSEGKLGWTAGNMPALELTTTGRKSDEPRSSMLTAPWSEGEAMAIVASAGGNDKHPAWFLNLQDEPSVSVRTQDGTRQMTARITSGEERTRLWDEISSKYKNYADYQTKTDREIPVVILEPAN